MQCATITRMLRFQSEKLPHGIFLSNAGSFTVTRDWYVLLTLWPYSIDTLDGFSMTPYASLVVGRIYENIQKDTKQLRIENRFELRSATFFQSIRSDFSCFPLGRDFHIFTILWPLVVNPTPHLICTSVLKRILDPILFATFHNYAVLDRDFYAPIIRLNCSAGFSLFFAYRVRFCSFFRIVNYSMLVFFVMTSWNSNQFQKLDSC